jgi:riboflavin biosynthesis pyrimidine reductase
MKEPPTADEQIVELHPTAGACHPLKGLYLAHNIREQSADDGSPFVYANFVASLDGRIAVPHPTRPGLTVPKATANDRDWRLFQELAAQADVIISSGRYLRDRAEGRAQEILQVDDPRYADLRAWREARGLPPLPDIAIVSRSLRFTLPDALTEGGRRVVFYTVENPDPDRVRAIEARAGEVVVAGDTGVQGERMLRHMAGLGYRAVYSAAGPRILHLLAADGTLDRLYLTLAHRLLGGDTFATIVDGPAFDPAVDVTLHTAYHDPAGLGGLGQLFLAYNTRARI